MNTWVEFAEGDSAYFSRYDPVYTVAIPVITYQIALTSVMAGAWEFCRRRRLDRTTLPHALFLAACLIPLGIGSVAIVRGAPFDLLPILRKPFFWPAMAAIAVVPFTFAVRNPQKASWWVRELLLYAWPAFGLILFQAGHNTLFKYSHHQYADGPAAQFLPHPPSSTRVVWIIFDELSQSIAFDHRPAGLLLPNLDRLRTGSFYARSAYAPASSTELSMPSLILGEKVTVATPTGTNDLKLATERRSDPFSWSSSKNIFDGARDLGYNTALAGWFHPYGRVLNRSLTKSCWTAGWLLSGIEEPFEPVPFPTALWNRAQLQFTALPLLGHIPGIFPGAYHRESKIQRFTYLLDRSKEFVADPAMGLVLLHLPIPHPPAIYDRKKGVMTAAGQFGYIESVAQADEALGALRKSMEAAGLWETTAIILSADHGWRTALWRGTAEWTADEEAASSTDTSGVPFLVKLPNQKKGADYPAPFPTIVTAKIIRAILEQRLTDPSNIAAFAEE